MSDETFTFTWLTGVKKLEPVRHWIREEAKRRFFRKRTEFFIDSEILSLGPFATRKEAENAIGLIEGSRIETDRSVLTPPPGNGRNA